MDPLTHLQERVEAWLGTLGIESPEGRLPVVRSEQALIVPSCFLHGDAGYVRLTALLFTDVEPSLPLLYRLLAMNNAALLGAFRLFEDRTLVYSATLPARTLDADTFAEALQHVAAAADTAWQELRPMAGGRSATLLTRPSDGRPTPEPPCSR